MSSSAGEELTRKQRREEARAKRKALEQAEQAGAGRRKRLIQIGCALSVGVVVLGAIFLLGRKGSSAPTAGVAGAYHYAVGAPAPGAPAPPIELPSTAGGQFSLAAQRGHSVLLYFQEGLTCQPCWAQLVDIQKNMAKFRAAGVQEVVSITVDPLSDLRQKVADESLSVPVLSDPGLVASHEYSANQYGMMGSSRDGHSFVLVGPDGRVRWRADYGGSPDYTMYVPVPDLLADLRKGTASAPA
jgi:peroxiredoxin Q/BCP